ncbi:MAG: type II toxin-antitoxin system Phd/YefM family antitoxin [Deltaproteobacteria bacterium]|nr:type II toxin-antitoxin system Phd/YefM family antitoxin [Deltaproteobacteria bacterium]
MGDFDQILPITDVKKDLLPLIKKVQRLHETVAITRNGKAAAVLMSLEEYEGLLETIEILGDSKLMKILNKSRKEMDEGKSVSHREVWGD